jgi:hypothetical protein
MLSNEVFALQCRAAYKEQGLVVDASNGQFAHSPLTRKECDTGYYLLWCHHQHQGLLQSRDLDKCCFFPADVLKWLQECDYFPENYFELWDIYEKYSSEHSRKNMEKVHAEKDEFGRSVNGVKNAERLHAEKDEFGRSLTAVKAAESTNSKKDELGRSVQGVKNAERLHAEKDELGRSLNAVKGSEKLHKERDELGKSLQGVRNAERIHAEKDDLGRSVVGVRAAESTNSKKDELGRSVNAVMGAEKVNSQIWESTVDGFRSTAGPVAIHNRANGWDPRARKRVY